MHNFSTKRRNTFKILISASNRPDFSIDTLKSQFELEVAKIEENSLEVYGFDDITVYIGVPYTCTAYTDSLNVYRTA